MAAATYELALAAVLVHEGGKVDHPKDPGGRTNKGVTQVVYDAYRARKGLSKKDVWNISMDEVRDIYRTQYWNVVRGDKLPPGVDYAVFDAAVNSGPKQAVKWLQRAVGVSADGIIGNITLRAVENYKDHDKLIADMCNRRMDFLRALKTWSTFGRGWTSRVNGVRTTAQKWARGSVGPAVTYTAVSTEDTGAKAVIEDAVPAPSVAIADASTGAGVGLGSVSILIEQVRESLAPMSTTSEFVGRIVTFLIIMSAVLTVGGLALRYIRKRKEAQRAEVLDIAEVSAA